MTDRTRRVCESQARVHIRTVVLTLIATGAGVYGALQIPRVERMIWPPVFMEERAPANFELRHVLLERRDGARASGDPIGTAQVHALLAREAYARARAVHRAWMRHRNETTGLISRGAAGHSWTYRDVGADLFGHKLNAALLLGTEHADALLGTLEAERAISGPDGLCRNADARTGRPLAWQGRRSRMFGSAEYAKDGLLPVVEMHGHPAVLARLLEVVGAITEHSDHQSRYGTIPDSRSEVNGEMLQVLCRLYFATGDERHARAASAIAEAAIGQMLPSNNGLPAKEYDYEADRAERAFVQIRDHGNELMVGLSEAYAMAVALAELGESEWAARADRWAEPLMLMYETLFEHGRNSEGLIVNQMDPFTLDALDARASDNWGYVLCGAELFVQASERHGAIGEERLRAIREQIVSTVDAVLRTDGLAWEGAHQDGYADSIESALYAAAYIRGVDRRSINRWVDRQIAALFHKQRSDGFVDEQYLDGNFIRTSLLYGMMRSGGWMPEPWAPNVGIGYERIDDTRAILVVQAGSDGWTGTIVPDRERHRHILRLPWDWPRINSWPEWCPGDRVESVTPIEGASFARHADAASGPERIGVSLPPHARVVFEIVTESYAADGARVHARERP